MYNQYAYASTGNEQSGAHLHISRLNEYDNFVCVYQLSGQYYLVCSTMRFLSSSLAMPTSRSLLTESGSAGVSLCVTISTGVTANSLLEVHCGQ